MHETNYKIWRWGEQTASGSNEQYNIAIRAKAKRGLVNPYEVANELFCERIGLALNLPIPVGVVLNKDDKLYYASLHVAVAGENLPPVTDEDVLEILKDELLTCRIIVFDSFVLNEDRNEDNISYDDTTKTAYAFDHGQAFFYNGGRQNLVDLKDSLCINHDNHCLAANVTTLGHFDECHARLLAIPEWYIHDTIKLASAVGLPPSEVNFCTEYFLDRRARLKDIFKSHYKTAFPKLDDGLLNPFQDLTTA